MKNRRRFDAEFARMSDEERKQYIEVLQLLAAHLLAERYFDSPGKQRVDGAKLMGVKVNQPSVN